MKYPESKLGPFGVGARTLSLAILLYWALFALLAPVTIWDAQVYNLARIPIAEIGGLFDNGLWTSERQLVFPWTFDAIHLPLLHIGWGFGVPSYLCLVGILVVAWSLLLRWHDATTAWVGCLALLGLPTLVFQGVGTKNDIPILFGIAVWLHALVVWRDSARLRYLVFGAMALAFAAGVKTSGFAPAMLCGGATLFLLRNKLRPIIAFGSALGLSLFLLGSCETYFESFRKFGAPLGPASFVQSHRNQDGLRGAAANGIRYAIGNIDPGAGVWQEPDRVTPVLEGSCRKLLSVLGLANAGHRPGADDATMRFLKDGYDSASDFGPLGTIGMLVLVWALFYWRPNEFWWRLSICAGLAGAAVCYSVAWMPWNSRFLMLPFAALTIALVSAVRRYSGPHPWPLWTLAALSSYAAIAYPLLSFNKRPRDLWDAVQHRQNAEFRERPAMGPIVAAAREWQATHPGQMLGLLPGTDSWVLPFFYDASLKVTIIRSTELAAVEAGTPTPAGLLVLNRPDFQPNGTPFKLVRTFPDESASALYEMGTGSRSRPTTMPGAGIYSDGWTAGHFTIDLANWTTKVAAFEVWNPTPLRRKVTLRSRTDTMTLDLEPQQRIRVQLAVDEFDRLEGVASPEFHPNGADARALGVRLDITQP